jgi:hypothetical protein
MTALVRTMWPRIEQLPAPRRRLERLAARIADYYFFGVIVLALVALPKTLRPAKASILVLPLVVAYYTMMHGTMMHGVSIVAAGGLAHAPLGKRLAGASRLQSDAT